MFPGLRIVTYLSVHIWHCYFGVFQGVKEYNNISYLTNLQRRKRIKEQAKRDRLLLNNA